MKKKTVTELRRALRLYARDVRKVYDANRKNWDAEQRLHEALHASAAEATSPLKEALATIDDSLGQDIGPLDRSLSNLRTKLADAKDLLT